MRRPTQLRTFGQESEALAAQAGTVVVTVDDAQAARRYITRYATSHGLEDAERDHLCELLGVAS